MAPPLTPDQEMKLRLLSRGLRISAEAEEAITRSGSHPLSMRDYASTSGVILRLGKVTYVNAPVFEDFCVGSPYRLETAGNGYEVRGDHANVPAEVVPISPFFFMKNSRGQPFSHYGIIHTDRLRLSPVQGCSYRCAFCDLPVTTRYVKRAVPDLVEALETGLATGGPLPLRHVLISGGTPVPGDRKFLWDAIREITRASNLPVDVMMVPWKDHGFLQQLRDLGVKGVSFNLELFGEKSSRDLMPQKDALGRDQLLDSLSQAVKVFGPGNVKSLILVGLEPPEDTILGVTRLAETGVLPVLSPFRPAPGTPLAGHTVPSAELLRSVWNVTYDVCKDHGLRPGTYCVPCHHNTLTFSDGSSYYS